MTTHDDALFGQFSGNSRLKQGNRFIRLKPDPDDGTPASQLAPVRAALELEGTFGVVTGRLDGNTLFETRLEEVIPPILSATLARLVKDGSIDVPTMLPKVEQSLRCLIGSTAEPATRGKALCAVVVGHRPSARGAVSSEKSVTEFDFNRELAAEISRRVKKTRVDIVCRDNTPEGLTRLAAKINELAPHFVISLHCNAFNGTATGTETLFFHTSTRARELAGIVQRSLLGALELADRKTKPRREGDRGAQLLKFTNAPCVICEPFFIDNDTDLNRAQRRRIGLANAYASAIDKAAQQFGP